MARKRSAGILLYRRRAGALEVFLVHPGGPFWARKDEGAWSIPKGEYEPPEDPLKAAKREFAEETGFDIRGTFVALSEQRQPSGKIMSVWAVEGDADEAALRSNTFTMEWPPKSGTLRSFPEVDRGMWFNMATARRKIHPGQRPFLDELETIVQGRTIQSR
ncbi:MAG TPA: NUDIX domain-containing protein [Nitrospira sp.]|nr:NUDIX domain-containing protein [Nitrospira sp.]